MFFRIHIFQGAGFLGSPCPGSESRMPVQVVEVAIYNTLIFVPVTNKMF